MSRSTAKSRIPELDGLRCIAVLAVVSGHYAGGPLARWVSAGWMGVDLFFVLSGFLITSILLAESDSPHFYRKFYGRRILRIFPLYFLLIAAYGIFLLCRPGSGLVPLWAASLGMISAWFPRLFLSAQLSHVGTVGAGLGVMWSLSVEEHFYAFWAPAVRYLRGMRLWIPIAAALLLCPLYRYLAHQVVTIGHITGVPEYYFVPSRLDSIAYGAGLALLVRTTGWRERVGRLAPLISLLGAVGMIGLFPGTHWKWTSRAFATAGPSCLGLLFFGLVAMAVHRTGSGDLGMRMLRIRAAMWVGQVSYCVYLIHEPMGMFFRRVAAAIFGANMTSAELAGYRAVGLAATFLAAGLSWRFFEGPILRYKDALLPREHAVAELAATAAAAGRDGRLAQA